MNNKKRFTPEEQRAKRLAFAKAYHERNKERIAYRQRYRELGEVFARFGYVLREPGEPEETYDEMKEVFRAVWICGKITLYKPSPFVGAGTVPTQKEG